MPKKSGLPCPVCSGPLSLVAENGGVVFLCPKRHVYHLDELVREQGEQLEEALRQALRIWEAKAEIISKIVSDNRKKGRAELAANFEFDLQRIVQRTRIIKDYLAQLG